MQQEKEDLVALLIGSEQVPDEVRAWCVFLDMLPKIMQHLKLQRSEAYWRWRHQQPDILAYASYLPRNLHYIRENIPADVDYRLPLSVDFSERTLVATSSLDEPEMPEDHLIQDEITLGANTSSDQPKLGYYYLRQKDAELRHQSQKIIFPNFFSNCSLTINHAYQPHVKINVAAIGERFLETAEKLDTENLELKPGFLSYDPFLGEERCGKLNVASSAPMARAGEDPRVAFVDCTDDLGKLSPAFHDHSELKTLEDLKAFIERSAKESQALQNSHALQSTSVFGKPAAAASLSDAFLASSAAAVNTSNLEAALEDTQASGESKAVIPSKTQHEQATQDSEQARIEQISARINAVIARAKLAQERKLAAATARDTELSKQAAVAKSQDSEEYRTKQAAPALDSESTLVEQVSTTTTQVEQAILFVEKMDARDRVEQILDLLLKKHPPYALLQAWSKQLIKKQEPLGFLLCALVLLHELAQENPWNFKVDNPQYMLAVRYLNVGARHYERYCAYLVGHLIYNKIFPVPLESKDEQNAESHLYYVLAADLGLDLAQYWLACEFDVEQDPVSLKKAIYYAALAARQGMARGMRQLSRLINVAATGLVDHSWATYIDYLYSLAAPEDLSIFSAIGIMFYNGQGFKKDLNAAFLLFNKSAHCAVDACYTLGVMHFEGQATYVDYVQSFKYLRAVLSYHYLDTRSLLAYLYETGKGGILDTKRAIELYRESCYYKHDSYSMERYAQILRDGEYGKQTLSSTKEALDIYELGVQIFKTEHWIHLRELGKQAFEAQLRLLDYAQRIEAVSQRVADWRYYDNIQDMYLQEELKRHPLLMHKPGKISYPVTIYAPNAKEDLQVLAQQEAKAKSALVEPRDSVDTVDRVGMVNRGDSAVSTIGSQSLVDSVMAAAAEAASGVSIPKSKLKAPGGTQAQDKRSNKRKTASKGSEGRSKK